MDEDTILDRYGRVTIARVVASFYSEVLRSPRLGHYFHHVEMSRLVDHQTSFMAAVMGGPHAFGADHIRNAHQGFHISRDDFQEMIRLLESSLLEHRISRQDTDRVLDGYRALQPHVAVSGG